MTEPNYINPAPGIWIDTGWRDIESAPRVGQFLVGAWSNHESGDDVWGYEIAHADSRFGLLCNLRKPTHWRPLPPPPAKEHVTNIAPEPGTLITGEKDCVYNGQGTPEDALRESR
jgi:hypothetical protein